MADVWKTVSDNLNRLNTITQQLSRLDKEVGSEDDGAQLRGDMKRLRDEGQDNIKRSKNLLAQPYDRSQRAKHDKLQAQLTELTGQFEKVAKVTISKEMERRLSQLPAQAKNNNNTQDNNPYGASSGSARPQQQQQTQAQQSNVDQLLLDERNNDIKELEKELTQLSEVFVDVLTLTKEQGEDLDTVANNTASANQQVEAGVPELKQANKYMCQYRKRMFILAVIVLAVIAVIIIIAVVVTNNNRRSSS